MLLYHSDAPCVLRLSKKRYIGH